jgi:hypothetical protein
VVTLDGAAYSVLRLMSKPRKKSAFSKLQSSSLNNIRVSMKCFELNSAYNMRKHGTLGGMTFTRYPYLL